MSSDCIVGKVLWIRIKMKTSSSSSGVLGTMSKKKKTRADLVKAKRESGWSDRVFNQATIPDDNGGPRTQMRKFNIDAIAIDE